MVTIGTVSSKLLIVSSSSRLALVLVVVLILFSVIGVALPQEGGVSKEDIQYWQSAHEKLASVLEPAGFFKVFQSYPFIITIVLLGINTATCTIRRFFVEGGIESLKGPRGMERAGFYLLHLSIILILIGGFLSSSLKLSGVILLIEGQNFYGRPENYLQFAQGPLRPNTRWDFVTRLKAVTLGYEEKVFLVDVASDLEVLENNKKTAEGRARINHPFSYKGITFSQDDTGFAPLVTIKNKKTGQIMVRSFVAFRTFQTFDGREYRDYLRLPFMEGRIIMTLLPSYKKVNDWMVKDGDLIKDPAMLVELWDKDDALISSGSVTAGKDLALEDLSFSFSTIRNWSSFRVDNDPGYPVVWLALMLGFIALILRYWGEMKRWFQEKPETGEINNAAS